MSRPLLVLVVALAAYAMLNIAASIAVAMAWRSRLAVWQHASPVTRSRRLLWLRAVAPLASVAIALGILTPAFAIFEPERPSEMAGPLIIVLALVASMQLAVSLWIAIASALRTRAAARAWLQNSVALVVDPPAGVPAYAIDSVAPIVALVGAVRPRLLAARSVVDACTPGELAAIVAHERGHLHSRDNLKRWLMNCMPDLLRWTPIHREIDSAWHDAAEDAADDAATTGDAASRVDLAALLIKIARLTPEPVWPAATVSPFVEPRGLNRRVRRLLAGEAAVASGVTPAFAAIAVCVATLAAAAVMRPETLRRLYGIIETLIAVGR
jgi:Zn-dependent protease with chaperone function